MIEMMVVLIIIAVLIGGGIRFYLGYIEGAKVTKAKANISTMQGALDAYYSENSEYPDNSAVNKGDELLNAGIKPGAWAASGDEIEAADPWGEKHVYSFNTTNGTYVVKTGGENNGHNVQGQTNYRVYGKGTKGVSDPPLVGSPATP